ncbi:RNA-binding protein [Marinobacter sp. C18]|uniref:RNA-binding protein n=1 Tax=Marinobacter sp. C18 TaxID=1772288 RepID=UPI000948E0DA|nr:RNA-binding protein [Marinobacter sp. C18]OLF81879.1 RNA-binding protein [Marinobacter sp. C18]
MADNTLHLNLKSEYFDQIATNKKPFEYRLRTEYWRKRLEGRSYQRVLVKKGYPKAGDQTRIIERPWRGYEEQIITHPHFDSVPVKVFAIRVN